MGGQQAFAPSTDEAIQIRGCTKLHAPYTKAHPCQSYGASHAAGTPPAEMQSTDAARWQLPAAPAAKRPSPLAKLSAAAPRAKTAAPTKQASPPDPRARLRGGLLAATQNALCTRAPRSTAAWLRPLMARRRAGGRHSPRPQPPPSTSTQRRSKQGKEQAAEPWQTAQSKSAGWQAGCQPQACGAQRAEFRNHHARWCHCTVSSPPPHPTPGLLLHRTLPAQHTRLTPPFFKEGARDRQRRIPQGAAAALVAPQQQLRRPR